MRILFCNIAWMKEYRGNEDGKDTPLNGGSYVDETGDAHEKYNFTPVNMEGKEGLYCLGAVYDAQRSSFCFRTAVFRSQRPPIFS